MTTALVTANARNGTAITNGNDAVVTFRGHGAEAVRIRCNTGAATGLFVSKVTNRTGDYMSLTDTDEKYALAAGESMDLFGEVSNRLLSVTLAPSTAADTAYSFMVLKR